jgi:hypothetical protein
MWHPDWVEPWFVGVIAVLVIGVAVIVFGAVNDRAKNRRRAAAMQAPPERAIPQLDPGAAGPAYVSDLQARRAPTDTHPGVGADLDLPATATIAVGYASRDFVTDPARRWAVLDGPAILVCADPVGSVRELLSILEKTVKHQIPLVIVAPALDQQVLSTLEVNRIQQKLEVVAVIAPEESDRARIAELAISTPTTQSDRQAGYVPTEHLGHAARWVSTATASYLLPIPDHG